MFEHTSIAQREITQACSPSEVALLPPSLPKPASWTPSLSNAEQSFSHAQTDLDTRRRAGFCRDYLWIDKRRANAS